MFSILKIILKYGSKPIAFLGTTKLTTNLNDYDIKIMKKENENTLDNKRKYKNNSNAKENNFVKHVALHHVYNRAEGIMSLIQGMLQK